MSLIATIAIPVFLGIGKSFKTEDVTIPKVGISLSRDL